MELISNELNRKLNALVTHAFYLNRILDRDMSLLSVKFKMLNSAKILHPKFAHAFPALADNISDYQDSRGMLTVYGVTPLADFDFENPIQMFVNIREEFVKYQDMVEDVIDSAIAEKDHATKIFLDGYLSKLVPFIASADNIVEVAIAYGNDTKSMQQFDDEIEHCLVV